LIARKEEAISIWDYYLSPFAMLKRKKRIEPLFSSSFCVDKIDEIDWLWVGFSLYKVLFKMIAPE